MAETGVESNLLRSKVDGYGFTRPADFDYETYEEFMAQYISVLARRASKWNRFIGNKTRISKSRKVKRFCRKGIPNEHRPMIWMCITECSDKMLANPNVYRNILLSQKDERIVEEINTDLHRTFPDNVYFTSSDDGLQNPLFNILVAVSHKNIDKGYCQGLNYVAGLMLLVLKNEEKVFWLLDTLINELLQDYYSKDMKAIRVEQELLGEIIRWKAPDIHAHIEKLEIPWALIATKWFLCVFADVMPIETVMRIWDCLFYEGGKILLRVAAMLIIQNREQILACRNFTQGTEMLKSIVNNPKIVNCHTFMTKCFDELNPFPRSKINKLRMLCMTKIN